MDLTNLSVSLSEVIDEESWRGKLFERLRRLVAEENWNGIGDCIGDETAAVIKRGVDSVGRDEYTARLGQIAKEETDKLNRQIKQALKDATSFQLRGSLGDKLIQLHKRTDDQNRTYGLLAVAFADRLTDLVFPAAERAAKLANLIVKERPSPEAEKYLEEACLCYFYELYSASAVMCRSVLEEVIEKRFGRLGIDPVAELGKDGCTLGALLGLAKRSGLRSRGIVPAEAWREVDTVNDLGSRAVHGDPLLEKTALDCLMAARHALVCILK
jgi:Domain of unknown function (DUF4145)